MCHRCFTVTGRQSSLQYFNWEQLAKSLWCKMWEIYFRALASTANESKRRSQGNDCKRELIKKLFTVATMSNLDERELVTSRNFPRLWTHTAKQSVRIASRFLFPLHPTNEFQLHSTSGLQAQQRSSTLIWTQGPWTSEWQRGRSTKLRLEGENKRNTSWRKTCFRHFLREDCFIEGPF